MQGQPVNSKNQALFKLNLGCWELKEIVKQRQSKEISKITYWGA